MALKKIPTWDEVQAWVNGNFNYYDDTDAAAAAPVQSVNGETGHVSFGGPIFQEAAKIETVNQWWQFFDNDQQFLEDSMADPARAEAIANSQDAMRVIFWLSDIQ